jgi:tRNA pseudouridine32 synthase/23S rRNA pseudouridine746 synthase
MQGFSEVIMPSSVNIVYQDEHLIVANKPAGLLSVPGKGPENQIC